MLAVYHVQSMTSMSSTEQETYRQIHAFNEDNPATILVKTHTFQHRLCGTEEFQFTAKIAANEDIRICILQRNTMLIQQELQCAAAYYRKGFIGTLFFFNTLTGTVYWSLLRQDEILTHYLHDVRACFDEILPNRWIRRRGSVDYPQHSSDLAALDIFMGILKR